jgi:hypothetical protein
MSDNKPVHVWEKQDIEFTASEQYDNPYTEVVVWVDLKGPGFNRRVYGFWNGDQSFVVRIMATAAGQWSWSSGSNQGDSGLNGQRGKFDAIPWTEQELAENPVRRGMIQPTPDGRGLQYADGTPFYLLGDTWWSVPTFRFPLRDDDELRPIGPEAGLKEYVHLRKSQGFNCIAIMAALPNWANDGYNRKLVTDDGTVVRAAWATPGTDFAMDMHNEGGRAFKFPGKVPNYEDVFPDVDRINPEYFKVLDKKIDYLNSQGFIPFLEAARRDSGQAWKNYYVWPDSYTRYVQYVFARYQANIMILSPIHYDHFGETIRAKEYNEACNAVVDRFGQPPFGTLQSANCSPSTLVNFGSADESRWLTAHQIGNAREHYTYWYLTEIYHAEPTRPAFNGEPYYSGLSLHGQYKLAVEGDSEADKYYVRSSMYGSFLSGAFAGYIYGCEGIWQADIEPDARVYMWDAFQYETASQVQHLRAFVKVKGNRYLALIPNSELLVPNKSGTWEGFYGWSYCAHSPVQDWFMIYFEHGCEETRLRSGKIGCRYQPTWFNPRTGEWGQPQEAVTVGTNSFLNLPSMPDEQDWGLMLELLPD